MSAYALPGLFPPLPLEYSIGIGISSCGSSWDSYRSTNEEKTDYEKSPVKVELPSVSPKVDISVKEAKIDALQLIQSLTTKVSTVPSQQSKKRGRHRNSPTKSTDTSTKSEASPQELAMQFELDVSYDGRKYTVVRSLYRMRQLREELVEELEHRQDKERREASDDCGRLSCAGVVPELPLLQGNGSANQSFSLLTALLRSYAPALEGWLQKLFRTVSTKHSPTLTHFLLEPLCFLHSAAVTAEPSFVFCDKRHPNTCRRVSSLASIEEHHEEHHEE